MLYTHTKVIIHCDITMEVYSNMITNCDVIMSHGSIQVLLITGSSGHMDNLHWIWRSMYGDHIVNMDSTVSNREYTALVLHEQY